MQVEIIINEDQVDKLDRDLAAYKNGSAKVLTRAVNKVAKRTRTKIAKAVRSEVAIKAKDVNKAITVRSGRYSNPTARIKIRGKRLPIIQFGATQTRSGIGYRIKKGGARKKIASGFLATMGTGHRGAFVRKGKERTPIRELLGPSIPAVVDGVRELARTRLSATIRRDLSREIDTQLAVLLEKGR